MEEHGVKFLQVMHMYVCSYDIKYVLKKHITIGGCCNLYISALFMCNDLNIYIRQHVNWQECEELTCSYNFLF